MSPLAMLAPAGRRAPARLLLAARPVRAFRVSARRPAHSEDDIHREDNRGAHIESHKKDSVDKAKSGKAEWKRELASSSEAAVKADREEIEASDETIKTMQKETEEMMKKSK